MLLDFLSNTENIFYFNVALVATMVVLILLLIWVLIIAIRLKKLFKGEKIKNLEGVLADLRSDLKKLNFSKEATEKYLETVEKRLQKSIQKINVIRFNPFEDAGSNQSFVTAFLDENGNGVVISSLYARDKVRIYAKPIKKYISEYQLSEEEKEAIKTASL